ncbi:hypothetical protein NIES2098_48940 [Calothrix sp. NIES-2098]|nr:hypothetical protein NIES2098_48940 [Calothrix sp. NIES-2098]
MTSAIAIALIALTIRQLHEISPISSQVPQIFLLTS